MAALTSRSPLRFGALLLLGLALAVWLGQGRNGPLAEPDGTTIALAPAPAGARPDAPTGNSRPEIGFRHARDLADHFAKHGAGSGAATAAEYLARAQALRDGPAGGDVLEASRADGVITRYDRRTGDFLAFNPDLTIRTFFRPNDGERYFRRQLQRGRSDG